MRVIGTFDLCRGMGTLLVLAVVFFPARALSSTGGDASLNADQKARYQKLCESLVAPCCWRESLARHRSPEALQGRDEVAALILEGKSDQEIFADFTSRYGQRVLMEPEGSRSGWLYTLPVLVLLVGVLVTVRFLRVHLRGRVAGEAAAPATDDPNGTGGRLAV